MMWIGFVAAVLIGITLGLIGGGGSILTVPVLVYLFGLNPFLATTYSLFIVGSTSLIGSISYFKQRFVNLNTVFGFGIPSIIAVLLTRAFILPAIPTVIGSLGAFQITKEVAMLLLFALVMILAASKMIRGKAPKKQTSVEKNAFTKLIVRGSLVGAVTGLVGAGGGFLIIPALVLMSRLPMKEAIGTSLVIISINSAVGFLASMSQSIIDWKFLLTLTSFSILGIFLGIALSKRIEGAKLKPAFGWFVLVMGIYILLKEIFLT